MNFQYGLVVGNQHGLFDLKKYILAAFWTMVRKSRIHPTQLLTATRHLKESEVDAFDLSHAPSILSLGLFVKYPQNHRFQVEPDVTDDLYDCQSTRNVSYISSHDYSGFNYAGIEFHVGFFTTVPSGAM